MAATAAVSVPHIPVGEYLGSVYRPDVDYVDGVLEERNVGEFDHADIQFAIMQVLEGLRSEGFRSSIETRVQVSATRFRVPDVCLLPKGWKKTQIIREAPRLCVEVLSPRDTVVGMRRRCEDYLRMGVPEVWIVDPQARVVFVMDPDGFRERSEGTLGLQGVPFRLDIQSIFATLDEA